MKNLNATFEAQQVREWKNTEENCWVAWQSDREYLFTNKLGVTR